ncbi:class E sortase [Streptomyces sp. TRM72054]|uniref:class E sortase n=1 Tax=Streptomyces sp. TRM72054 TaxID=2870562 RepID=UPI001C8CA327|nr:class E sortase [Streptomyces sp. TRM72054]MBX9396502.1 class E sortase [Streptomyces sp. TRM72054]
MTALRPERESGAAGYGDAGDQGTSYGQQPYGVPGALGDWYGQQPYDAPVGEAPLGGAPVDEETMALRVPPPPGESLPAGAARATTGATVVTDATAGAGAVGLTGPTPGGRAARRKAAKRRHGRHAGHAGHAGHADHADHADHGAHAAPPAEPSHDDDQRRPLSRVEARRLARARKPSPAVVASRLIGEVFITTGVLMLLFVTYQLWWTNVRAHAQAGNEASQLQNDWASGKRNPGVFQPGQGFALLHIPKLDVVVPIAEGISNDKVLDRGMVGHYAEGALKTAMPDAKTGNFGLAGHRNTHGEPFRYINRLQPGDPIVVETQDMYYVYDMASILPVTSPSNVGVLNPIPKGSGFTEPGRYITLTTCTPEFTSKYRMIVWGKMVEERPRSKGKPDALVS